MSEIQPDIEVLFWGSKASKRKKYFFMSEEGASWELAMLTMIFFLMSLSAGFAVGKYYEARKQDRLTGEKTSTSSIQKSELKTNDENKYTWM